MHLSAKFHALEAGRRRAFPYLSWPDRNHAAHRDSDCHDYFSSLIRHIVINRFAGLSTLALQERRLQIPSTTLE